MGNNVIAAISNIINYENYNIEHYKKKENNSVTSSGSQLEQYIMDALAGSYSCTPNDKKELYKKVFSTINVGNRAPDLIVWGGDAFEIKKVEKKEKELALNSSHPHDLLRKDSQKISLSKTDKVMVWSEKNIYYVIGHVNKIEKTDNTPEKKEIKSLFFVDGECLAAGPDVYQETLSKLKSIFYSYIEENGCRSKESKEIGRITDIDPKKITQLRVRGMWIVEYPTKVFGKQIKYELDTNYKFQLFAIMRRKKYYSYPLKDRIRLRKTEGISICRELIDNPKKPDDKMPAVFIKYSAE